MWTSWKTFSGYGAGATQQASELGLVTGQVASVAREVAFRFMTEMTKSRILASRSWPGKMRGGPHCCKTKIYVAHAKAEPRAELGKWVGTWLQGHACRHARRRAQEQEKNSIID